MLPPLLRKTPMKLSLGESSPIDETRYFNIRSNLSSSFLKIMINHVLIQIYLLNLRLIKLEFQTWLPWVNHIDEKFGCGKHMNRRVGVRRFSGIFQYRKHMVKPG